IDQHLQAGTFFLGVAALSGSGTFRLSTSFTATSAPFASSLREFNGSDVQLASADLNGDGIPDLVVTDPVTAEVTVLLGRGDGTFRRLDPFAVPGGAGALVEADFNHDGRPDLAVAGRDSAVVTVLLGNGDGTFRLSQSFGTSSTPGSLAVGDLNGDGRSDLIVLVGASLLTTYLSQKDGGFLIHSQQLGGVDLSLATGDF